MARKKKIDKEMGLRLKQARTEQKLTYEELAEKSGVGSLERYASNTFCCFFNSRLAAFASSVWTEYSLCSDSLRSSSKTPANVSKTSFMFVSTFLC